MFLYKPQKRATSDLIRDMVKKKRKPRVYNWIARGYKDALANTPYKHAPTKKLETKARDTWTPEEEQYMDGLLSAQEDQKQGLMHSDDSKSLPANTN